MGQKFGTSTLQDNIKGISAHTWEQINGLLVEHADTNTNGIEKGREVRIDCTVVESNIHAPYDSELLLDAVRGLARNLAFAKAELSGTVMEFSDHRRRAKRTCLEILNAKTAAQRKKAYKDLMR